MKRVNSFTEPTEKCHAAAQVAPPSEPAGWPAWRLAEEIISRKIKVVEVVESHLERLEQVNSLLNAAVTVDYSGALADAAVVQGHLDAGHPPGPLCGVPFSVKDVIAVRGMAARLGSLAFGSNVARVDASCVTRLRGAGAIVIAKSNCPEFAFGVTTDSPFSGATRNPWGSHSPGGSSGGEAALVASGASAFGLGTDYGGSLRWPAQCCGILALRPAPESTDGAGQLPGPGGRMDGSNGHGSEEPSVQGRFQVVGPMARNARDLATLWSVLANAGGSTVDSERKRASLTDVSVGWLVAEDSCRVSTEIASSMADLADALAEAGVRTICKPGVLDSLHMAFNSLRDTDDLARLRSALGAKVGLADPRSRKLLADSPTSRVDPAPLWESLSRLRSRVLEHLVETPVTLVPVAPVAACRMDGTAEIDGVTTSGFALMAYCRAVSALRLPAISIPYAIDGFGLPLSVQAFTTCGREHLLFELAELIEAIRGGVMEPPWLSS